MVEDKIVFFAKVIYEKIDEETKKTSETFDSEKEKQLSDFLKSLEDLKIKEVYETEKKAQFKANEIITKEKLASKQEILLLRENLINKVVSALEDKFLKFTETAEYINFLMELIKRSVSQADNELWLLYVTEKDFQKYSSEINEMLTDMNKSNISLYASTLPFIGGIILEDKNAKFRLDYSFSRLIEDNKAYIGLKVSYPLEQVVSLLYEG
jgi:vacuolar-type H+-ATPase subunit E/Vma4